ncbi:uncharacterized protein N0V89_002122 [Didymosphaeria variabile]|uniref:Cytochrome b5 heme-binding domain-containing protein n=1 Tax=Didymosphaeria variabile TaxID=1932322 RepID=A0A9W9CDA5_9PLEO|nr:uncharacterized protein N0V89_002122 [Didymosphaeria variabile]KAJ4357546.1 hypothetical protein N0V89_002122 [Didymosphaeria variabile]
MLVAFSLLAISLSFLFLKHPPSSWRAYVRQTAPPPAERKPSQPTANQEEPAADPPPQTDNHKQRRASSSPSPEGTPRATPSDSANGAVPTFTLAAHESSDEDEEDSLPPPSFPALNSAQRASAPSPAIAMRPPTEVLLSPGHSPLDWANLQRSGTNMAGVPSLLRVTPAMLKENNGRKGRPAWSSYEGKVYNITPYLPFHPGGEGELRRAAGKDGRKLFMEVHPWVNWDNMLGECLVGIMVTQEQALPTSSLEDMD